MSYVTGRVTISGTPTQTIVVGFQPTWARFTVGGKGSDTVTHFSFGATDGTNQSVQSTFGDTTGGASFNSGSKLISHYERVSGSITEVLSASFNSFTATGIKLNVSIANTGYSVTLEAGN
jgi:hypothetical protein